MKRARQIPKLDPFHAKGSLEGSNNRNLKESLVAKNISKIYGPKTIIDDISLEVRAGETVAILGPNGAGKTTCFQILAGIISPDFGQILLNGQDITKIKLSDRARLKIHYLSQENTLFNDLSLIENILMFKQLLAKYISKELINIDTILVDFNLSHITQVKAGNLSGGEAKRLEIAIAMMLRPKFLLMDEPFAALDPISIIRLQKYIPLLTKQKVGIIITDHNVKETLAFVKRCYIIDKGKILLEGSAKDALLSKKVQSIYLGNRNQKI